MQPCQKGLVKEGLTIQGHGAETGFRVSRNLQFPHDDQIKGKTQYVPHPDSHRNAACGNRKDHPFLDMRVLGLQHLCQDFSRFKTIIEQVALITKFLYLMDYGPHVSPAECMADQSWEKAPSQ